MSKPKLKGVVTHVWRLVPKSMAGNGLTIPEHYRLTSYTQTHAHVVIVSVGAYRDAPVKAALELQNEQRVLELTRG